MVKNKNIENNEQAFQEFYLAIKSSKKEFVIYESEPFKLSEIDIINLIKICIMEARSKTIGKKILAIYEDATRDREEITKQRLKYIGILENEKPKPTTTKKNSTSK